MALQERSPEETVNTTPWNLGMYRLMIVCLLFGPFGNEHFKVTQKPDRIEVYTDHQLVSVYTESERNQGLADCVVFEYDGKRWVDGEWLQEATALVRFYDAEPLRER